jgi:hypothetical protein
VRERRPEPGGSDTQGVAEPGGSDTQGVAEPGGPDTQGVAEPSGPGKGATSHPGDAGTDGPRRLKMLIWLLVLLSLAALVRVPLFMATDVKTRSDTLSYLLLAKQIQHHDLTFRPAASISSSYDAYRTPGYPLFLLAFGQDLNAVRAAQLALGVLLTALVFWIAWRWTKSAPAAALAGAAYGLSLMQIGTELTILTETLTAVLVTACVLVSASMEDGDGVWFLVKSALLGVAVSALLITRPTFVFVPFVFIPQVFRLAERSVSRMAPYLALALIPMVSLIAFNAHQVHYAGISTGVGYSLINHSYKYIAEAPQEYAGIRDPYVEYIARYKNDFKWGKKKEPAFWAVQEEIRARTGWSTPKLSQELTKMSLYLFARHPLEYLSGVVESWVGFWSGDPGAYFVWRPGVPAVAKNLAEPLFRAGLGGGSMMGGAFVLVSLVGAALLAAKTRLMDPSVWPAIAIVMLSSLVTAFIEGANGRYSMPVEPLMAAVIVSLAVRFAASAREGGGAAVAAHAADPAGMGEGSV